MTQNNESTASRDSVASLEEFEGFSPIQYKIELEQAQEKIAQLQEAVSKLNIEIARPQTTDEIVRNDRAHNTHTCTTMTENNTTSATNNPTLLSLKDVDTILPKFSGDSSYSVSKFLADFEEHAELFEWNELQKFVYCKKLLIGTASLFVRGISVLTYMGLKHHLKNEFGGKLSQSKIHKKLAVEVKKSTESLHEYVLRMAEIGREGEVDESSIIEYIVDGITDGTNEKAFLYEAQTMKELKSKLVIYERVHTKSKKSLTSKVNAMVTNKGKSTRRDCCFKCGEHGHRRENCTAEAFKCFRCQGWGHIAVKCPKIVIGNKGQEENNKKVNSVEGRLTKNVVVNGREVEALVDTGSDVTLLRSDECVKLRVTNIKDSKASMTGFGQKEVNTLGQVELKIVVDDVQYSVNVYIVPEKAMSFPMILGMNLMKTTSVLIEEGSEVKFLQRNEEQKVMNILIEDASSEVNGKLEVESKYQQEVTDMITSYEPKIIEEQNVVKMKIILKDDIPVVHRPRRMSVMEKEHVEKQIEEWLNKGVIEPACTDYASSIVLVRKKDNAYRLCVDFRALNEKVVRDRFPLPVIEDLLSLLQSSKFFSVLDLKEGFFHVQIDNDSKKFTGFVTHNGHYQFRKAPFGLCNSPSAFQRYINYVFRQELKDGVVLIYVDDIVVLSISEDEALENLQRVLKVAAENGLRINWKKCQFFKKKVEYLGHVIENGEVKPSTSKTIAVRRFPEPRNVRAVQQFLGLTGFFRKFIPQYAIIARPLSNLLKDGIKFKFEEEQREAFNELKRMLISEPVLKIFCPGATTEIHTDASKLGYGAVLLQVCTEDNQLHPVYYMSRKTTTQESNYSSYELEVLAVVSALKKFRVYVLGQHVKIVTDCSAFEMTMRKRDLIPRIARWALYLQEFDYVIEHRTAQRMKHVDALSRHPVMSIEINQKEFLERLKTAQSRDEYIRSIKTLVSKEPFENFVVKGELLYKEVNGEQKLVVPKKMQRTVIETAHGKGHFGVKKVKDLLQVNYWFTKMHQRIADFIENCIPCILSARKKGKQEGFLQPIPKGDTPLDTFHVDHVGPLPSTNKNYKYIFVVSDAFSKFTWLFPTKTVNAEEGILKLELLQTSFGNPRRIISDKGAAFTSMLFKEFCRRENIEHITVTTGVARGNGQAERAIQTTIAALTKMSVEKPTQWYKFIPKLQMHLNGTLQRSIGYTPFEVLFGVKMKLEADQITVDMVNEQLALNFNGERERIRQEAREHIERVQDENRRTFDKGRKEARRYRVDDEVAIKRTQFGAGLKIFPKYLGPYRVTRCLRNNRYEVDKIGSHEGPGRTSTAADFMKPWGNYDTGSGEDSSSEADEDQDGRM